MGTLPRRAFLVLLDIDSCKGGLRIHEPKCGKKEIERVERDDGKGEALNVIDKFYVRVDIVVPS